MDSLRQISISATFYLSVLLFALCLLPGPSSSNKLTKCQLTHLIPMNVKLESVTDQDSVKVLDSYISSTTPNAELSLYIRFKIAKMSEDYINIFEYILKKNGKGLSVFVKVRYSVQKSEFEIYMLKSGSSEFEISIIKVNNNNPMKENIWYYLSISFNFSKGKGAFIVSQDNVQAAFKNQNYFFSGLTASFSGQIPSKIESKQYFIIVWQFKWAL